VGIFLHIHHSALLTLSKVIVTSPCGFAETYALSGETENARMENAGRSKMQRWKTRDLKMRQQYAGVENAGPENAGQNARAENAGPSSMESYLAIKCANGILMLCQPDIGFSALSTVITNRTQPMCLNIMYDVW